MNRKRTLLKLLDTVFIRHQSKTDLINAVDGKILNGQPKDDSISPTREEMCRRI